METLEQNILYSLDGKSRKSLTKISQEVGVTPQLVKYHLEKLEKSGVILTYWPMIEFRKLGYFNVSYFVKTKNLTPAREKELYAILQQENRVNILMRGDGYWDFHFTISARSLFQALEVFNAFYDQFHETILSYDTAISVGFFQFRREYLRNKIPAQPEIALAYTGSDVPVIALKPGTLRILEAVNRDARQSIAELGTRLHLSRDTVARTLAKLERDGIIQSYSYVLNHEKVGYPRYRLLVQVTDLTSATFKKFFHFCQQHPNIIHVLKLLGNWQLLLDIEIESREKLRELTRGMLQEYGEIIVRIENTQVYKIDKFRDVPLRLV